MEDDIRAIYDWLWEENFPPVSRGDVEIDPYITHPETDHRRGLTLIFRPSSEIKQKILTFLEELRAIEPDQYCYSAESLHFTVLSLFTAIPAYQHEYDRLEKYQNAVENSLMGQPAFSLSLQGITVSRGAVMICGFPSTGTLNSIRDCLRQNLIENGLSQGLDIRYTLRGAHTTVLRFAAPLSHPGAFREFLQENRHRQFGSMDIHELQLVKNDWYMSKQHTAIMCRFEIPFINGNGKG